jgi:hypothetical protein
MGAQPALIQADVSGGPPPERPAPGADDSADSAAISAAEPVGSATAGDDETAGGTPTTFGPALERLSSSEKGSLLIFPVIEVRWDSEGVVLQDAFIDLTNDFPEDVQVQMYFVNGDPPLP